jgi:hypothetical protein
MNPLTFQIGHNVTKLRFQRARFWFALVVMLLGTGLVASAQDNATINGTVATSAVLWCPTPPSP